MTKPKTRPNHPLFALYGSPYAPNACRCGYDKPMMDHRGTRGQRGPYFIWCPDCECAGPERPTYALALAAWNHAICTHDHSEIRVVDNTTT